MVLARVNAKAKITEAKFLTGGYEDGAQEEEQVGNRLKLNSLAQVGTRKLQVLRQG